MRPPFANVRVSPMYNGRRHVACALGKSTEAPYNRVSVERTDGMIAMSEPDMLLGQHDQQSIIFLVFAVFDYCRLRLLDLGNDLV